LQFGIDSNASVGLGVVFTANTDINPFEVMLPLPDLPWQTLTGKQSYSDVTEIVDKESILSLTAGSTNCTEG
jgi:hypothetical protein